MEFKEYDAVRLTVDLPAEGLRRGAVGTVLLVFREPELAYEVEFSAPDGSAIAELALLPHQVEAYEP